MNGKGRRRLAHATVGGLLALVGLAAWAPPAQADGQVSWSAPARLATSVTYVAAAADDAGGLHVVWTEQGEAGVRHRAIGGPWWAITCPGTAAAPDLRADSRGQLHLVWDNHTYVYYAVWRQGAWSTPVALPKTTRFAFEPRLALDEAGCPHVVFWGGEQLTDYEPFYTSLQGAGWGAPRSLRGRLEPWSRVDLAVAEGTLHMGFLYTRSDGKRSLAYSRSTDGGASWSAPEEVAGTTAPVALSRPCLVFWREAPLLAWMGLDWLTSQYAAMGAGRTPEGWQSPGRLGARTADQKALAAAMDDDDHLMAAWLENAPGYVQNVVLGRTDLAQASPQDPLVFDWSGIGTSVAMAASPSGARVVAWLTAGQELDYTYHVGFRPSSAVGALPETVARSFFAVSWAGTDRSGTGVRCFDIQVRDGRSPWRDWLAATRLTSASFMGLSGHTYYFRSRATDNAGNVEPWPLSADASTTVLAGEADLRCFLPLIRAP